MRHTSMIVSLAVACLALTGGVAAAQARPFELHGTYVEGCSCRLVCACALHGKMAKGCHGIAAMIITSGSYGDADLADTRIAGTVGDDRVHLFIDTEDAAKRQAAEELARKIFAEFGEIVSVADADIQLTGSDGTYELLVDEGKTIQLSTEPVLGADGKTAITYTNYPVPIYTTIRQSRVVSGRFNDEKDAFELEGTNSFFNGEWSASGEA